MAWWLPFQWRCDILLPFLLSNSKMLKHLQGKQTEDRDENSLENFSDFSVCPRWKIHFSFHCKLTAHLQVATCSGDVYWYATAPRAPNWLFWTDLTRDGSPGCQLSSQNGCPNRKPLVGPALFMELGCKSLFCSLLSLRSLTSSLPKLFCQHTIGCNRIPYWPTFRSFPSLKTRYCSAAKVAGLPDWSPRLPDWGPG